MVLALEAAVEAVELDVLVLDVLVLAALGLDALAGDEADELGAPPPQPASITAKAMAIARTATFPNVFMVKLPSFLSYSFPLEMSLLK